MNMILHAADFYGHTIESSNSAAEVFVETRSPIRTDQRTSHFGGTDPVIMEAVKCGTHVWL